jgi:uncharacterized coiled-coil protein SlyX
MAIPQIAQGAERRGPALSGVALVLKPAKACHVMELLSSARESPMLGLRLQETDMVADSNSQIAWHRAQIRKHRETLKHLETARFSFGEIAGSKTIDQTQETVARLKRKIRDSEQIIASYERQTRRPLTTDYQTLANVPWSNWNARSSSNT